MNHPHVVAVRYRLIPADGVCFAAPPLDAGSVGKLDPPDLSSPGNTPSSQLTGASGGGASSLSLPVRG